MSINRNYFHTFDSLRFFSFILVFLHHVAIPDSSFFYFFSRSGGIGVSFFFVLSGFLITYILLYEKNNEGTISLKKFYIRRVLRIWPLFYAMLLFAFLTPYILAVLQLPYSNEGYTPNWIMSILFLENYNMMISNSFPNVSPLRVMWTLCIEEHFYIFWGILIYVLSLKKVPHLILSSIILANVSRIIYNHYGLMTIDLFTNIDYFAFGAIPAYIFVLKKETLKKIEKIPLKFKYFVLLITVILIFGIPNSKIEWINFISPTLFGISFSSIILFTLTPKNEIRVKDNLWISKLGKYTYGLYLFHTIVIMLFSRVIVSSLDFSWQIILLLSLLGTIIVSIISYNIFEKQFLKLKARFY